MNCRINQELMSRYIDGDLATDEQEAFEQHIKSCAECERALAELRASVDFIRGLPTVSAPEQLTSDTMAIVRREAVRQRRKTGKTAWYIAAAAAALFVVVIGASGLFLPDRMHTLSDAPQEYGDVTVGAPDHAATDSSEGALSREEEMARDAAPPGKGDYDVAGSEEAGVSSPVNVSYERKTIMSADVSVTSDNFDEAQNRVALIVEREGGYVQHSNMWTVTRNGDKYRAMNVLMRVPADSYYRVVAELMELGELEEKRESGRDVTEEYYDIDSRVRNLRRQEDRLLELLGKANNVDEILRVEHELSRVRGDIEQLTGRLRFLDHVVAMSAISITIQEPIPDQIPDGEGFWGRLVAAFLRTLAWLKSAAEKALVITAGALPFAIIAVVIWLGVRYMKR